MYIEKIKEILGRYLNREIRDICLQSEGFQNIVFTFKLDQMQYVGRLSCKQKKWIKAEIEWMDFLQNNGIRLAAPIQFHGLDKVNGITINQERYVLSFFQHTGGRPVDVLDQAQWNGEFFYEWGSKLAFLHNISGANFDRPEGSASISSDEKWVNDCYKSLNKQLNNFPKTPNNFGLIHNDFHQGNFHMVEGEIVLFDFDDCAYQFFAQDLAVSIYHALWTGTAFHPEWEDFPNYFLTHLLKGYLSKRHLSEDTYDRILILLQMREIVLFTLFKEKWKPENMEEWQFEKLRELESNILEKRIPYEKELEKVKHYFVVVD
ncbi:phosphotransferase enzyme family protein [Lederbergia wuyishanensis]|uniref:Ser/Thr protein kinase RdoA (MazF antagonist) n=1 Tax=Lederbergia wuyishanensis TaxID=1347903 RepID=A0ABU0D4Z1_9BACI|nr:phosphotransferase [Lederbergia wuyishanensis]MCJ8009572.1 phosphotransferase [Lederbergia wuyishanensis]MDQ0343478.1 Ser/Thr protein kinase RdoA (MazF antagonist) [Lederbergia wuyishanensis]